VFTREKIIEKGLNFLDCGILTYGGKFSLLLVLSFSFPLPLLLFLVFILHLL
jgi:hypothetical protein